MINLLFFLLAVGAVFFLIQWLIRGELRKSKRSPFIEPFLRSPGYRLGQQLDDLRSAIIVPIASVVFSPFIFFASKDYVSGLGFYILLMIFLLIAAVGVFMTSDLYQRSRKIKLDFYGELYTGQELNYLMREGAFVYHDVPYQHGNIGHIIVSQGGIFVVETQVVTKGAGQKNSPVRCHHGSLIFPHMRLDEPVKLARDHAKWLENFLKRKLGFEIPVIPVVALPGWLIEDDNQLGNVLVINPKRGAALQKSIHQLRLDKENIAQILPEIESFSRDVYTRVDLMDPYSTDHYHFNLSRHKA